MVIRNLSDEIADRKAAEAPAEFFCYSADGEHFNEQCASREEAAELGFESYPDRETIKVGRCVPVKTIDFVDANSIVESIDSRAADVAGEAAEDWCAGPVDAEFAAKLEALVAAAIEEAFGAPTFWTVTDVETVQRPEAPQA